MCATLRISQIGAGHSGRVPELAGACFPLPQQVIRYFGAALAVAMLLISREAAVGQVVTTRHSFKGSPASPYSGLVQANDGSFCGTSDAGGIGQGGAGTVYRVTTDGGMTLLHEFGAELAGYPGPTSALTKASDGSLYGTTPVNIFKISPSGEYSVVYTFTYAYGYIANSSPAIGPDGSIYVVAVKTGAIEAASILKLQPNGVEMDLYDFTDDQNPEALVMGTDGNLYGTTGGGETQTGGYTAGTIFKITTQGSFTLLYTFPGRPAEVANSVSALVEGPDGNFYGTTAFGGSKGAGMEFQITPQGQLKDLYDFGTNANDGGQPTGLILGQDGNFYGAARTGGGSGNNGVVFELTLQGVETVLYRFGGQPADGASPVGTLVQAEDGNFYGVTRYGGLLNDGAVYRVTPGGVENLLYSFGTNPLEGDSPEAPVITGQDGNVYGTTTWGGSGNVGTVFRMTPDGTVTVLHSFVFGGSDGYNPNAQLVQAPDGTLYGTAPKGGAHSRGIVFQITPQGEYTVLYAFGATAGDAPPEGLLLAPDGNLYGTMAPIGAVFKLTTEGVETVLYRFGLTGTADGTQLNPELALGRDGYLYGTTNSGGTYGKGTFFQLTLSGTLTVLHHFGALTGDGLSPVSGPILGQDGAFYGTAAGGINSDGSVYRITSEGLAKIVYSFGQASGDGINPLTRLIQAKDGTFFGVTIYGGSKGSGALFQLTPQGAEKVLYSFGTNANDGIEPTAGLSQAADGSFYGTTQSGGTDGNGVVFQAAVATAGDPVLHPSGTGVFTISQSQLAPDPEGIGLTIGLPKSGQPGYNPAAATKGASITYTPQAGYRGNDTIVYTITDRNGNTATGLATLVNQAPTAGDLSVGPAESGIPYLIGLVSANDPGAIDADGDAVTVASFSQPAHGTLVLNANGRDLTYTPDSNFHGGDSFTYSLADSFGLTSDTHTVAITVVPQVLVTNLTFHPLTLSPFTIPISQLGSDGAGLPLTLSLAPTGSAGFDPAASTNGNSIVYLPQSGFTGNDQLLYYLTDSSGGTASGVLTLVNHAPAARDFSKLAASSGTPLAIDLIQLNGLTAGDADGDPVSIASFSQPAHGTVEPAPGGSGLIYTAAADFAGQDSFTYSLADPFGLTSAPATISMLVFSQVVSANPVLHSPAPGAFSIGVAQLGTDSAGLPLSVSVGGSGSTFTNTTDGQQIVYTPPASSTGNDMVFYTLFSEDGTATTGLLTMVNHAPRAADLTAAPLTFDSSVDIDLVALNGESGGDPDGDPVTLSASQSSHGQVTIHGHSLHYTPLPEYSGPDLLSYTLTDPFGMSATGTLSLTVLPPVNVTVASKYSKGGPVAGAGEGGSGRPTIPPGAEWRQFGTPALNANDALATRGTWRVPGGEAGAGIFAGDEPVAIEGESSGLDDGSIFSELHNPLLNDDGDVAFLAELSAGSKGPRTSQSLWTNGLGGTLQMVARTGVRMPGAGAPAGVPAGTEFADILSVALDGAGPGPNPGASVVFTANLKRGSGGDNRSLWVAQYSSLRLLLQAGDRLSVNGRSRVVRWFQALTAHGGSVGQGHGNAQGKIVALIGFADRTQAIGQFDADTGSFTPIAATGQSAPDSQGARFLSLGAPAQSADGTVIGFTATTAARNRALPGLFEWKDGTLHLLWAGGERATPSGAFKSFLDPAVNENGEVLAKAKLAWLPPSQDTGLFWNHDGIPAGAKWADFVSYALPDGGPGPLFTATLAVPAPGVPNPARLGPKNNLGLWSCDAQGRVALLLRTGQFAPGATSGKRIASFAVLSLVSHSPSQTRSFNDHGNLAVKIGYDDGFSEIAILSLPTQF